MTDSEKLDILLQKTEKLDTKLNAIEQEVSNINLVLENEIRVNIQRVAEGHLDIARNLHEAVKPSNELEMLSLKVTMHDSEIPEIKQKIS